jgi:hypothetical protein
MSPARAAPGECGLPDWTGYPTRREDHRHQLHGGQERPWLPALRGLQGGLAPNDYVRTPEGWKFCAMRAADVGFDDFQDTLESWLAGSER